MGSLECTTKTYFLTLWVDINEAVTLPANPKLINCWYIYFKLALLQFPWGDEAQVLVLAVPQVRTLHRCSLLPGSVLAKLCLGNLWRGCCTQSNAATVGILLFQVRTKPKSRSVAAFPFPLLSSRRTQVWFIAAKSTKTVRLLLCRGQESATNLNVLIF